LKIGAVWCFDRYEIIYRQFLACAHNGHNDTLVRVRVIARSTLREFVETLKGTRNYAPVKSSLDAWFHEVEAASWKNPAEVKAAYANASIIGNDRVVFNIKGNSFRLVVAVDYLRQVVFIKWVGSHAVYDRIDAAKVNYEGKADQK
jgi:mRNA interferase HigB